MTTTKETKSIIITPELYVAILKSKEYIPYLLLKKADGNIYLNYKKLPKDRYLPINDNYEMGWKFINIINDCDCADLILIKQR